MVVGHSELFDSTSHVQPFSGRSGNEEKTRNSSEKKKKKKLFYALTGKIT